MQDISFNEKLIAKSESTVRACEDELEKLKDMIQLHHRFWRNAPRERAKYLLEKMLAAERKIGELEKKNNVLKKVLARSTGGGSKSV